MAPRPPNYSQDRLQRERAQAAKAKEKAERRAEETARRKAEQAKPDAGRLDQYEGLFLALGGWGVSGL
jgi:hypothetical protein